MTAQPTINNNRNNYFPAMLWEDKHASTYLYLTEGMSELCKQNARVFKLHLAIKPTISS